MNLQSLSLIVTDECNFNCKYCYKPKSKNDMDFSLIERALDFFLPYLTENCYINFYGGEPLLSFDLINRTISFLNSKKKEFRKKINYSITTNGILLTEEVIHFLNENKFSVELSFDGLAQDMSRKKGSAKRIVPIVKELLNHSNINLETNSVFTPDTIGYLSESIKFIMNLGVSDIRCSISTAETWDKPSLVRLETELTKLREILLSHHIKYSNIPVVNFRNVHAKGIFYCAAGKDRLTIAPDGGVWGCFLFADYFRGKEDSSEYNNYFYGNLDDFMKDHEEVYPRVSSHYAQLSVDNFRTSKMECFLCKEYTNCAICPINASLSGTPLGQIPNHVCEIQKMKRRQKERFRKELGSISKK